MKKILMVIILLLVTVFAFAQMDDDGFDWMTWNLQQKTYFILGFYSSMQEMGEMFIYLGSTEEEANALTYIPYSIGNMIQMIDSFYSKNRMNRNEYIRTVIFWLADLDYWNKESAPTKNSNDL